MKIDCVTRELKNLPAALAMVFARPSYRALGGACAIAAFVLAVWLPNLALLGDLFFESEAPITAKLDIALNLLGGIATNFTPLAAGYTIAIALLFGAVIAMIVYLFRQKLLAAAGQNMALGSGAMASGAIGIGCAACGSLIFGGGIPLAGAVVALLPLNGAEFGLLGVVLLFTSLLLTSRRIVDSVACPVTRKRSA